MRRPFEAEIRNVFLFTTGAILIAWALAAVGLIVVGAGIFAGLSSAGTSFSVIFWSVVPLVIGGSLVRTGWKPRPPSVLDSRSLPRVLGGAGLMLVGVSSVPFVLLGSLFSNSSLLGVVVALLVWAAVPVTIGVRLLRHPPRPDDAQ